ncbi:MAG: hypothetical protein N3D20_01880 [Candidatus Pacearchaeota archaeon]|nr:hypothetical protein [Candidatus Pacearchaeota archaeon]
MVKEKNTNSGEENEKIKMLEAKLEAEEEEQELKEIKKIENKSKNREIKQKKKISETKKSSEYLELNDLKRVISKHKEVVYAIIWILILVIVFVVSFYLFRNIGRIEYEGMYFVKEKLGEVILYHYKYYIMDEVNGKIYSYNLYLRNDPRKNNVNVEADGFKFFIGKPFILGLNSTGLGNCSLSMVAMDTLIQFIMYNNHLQKPKVGTVDKNESMEKNMTYVRCEKYPLNTVIIIESANESKIIGKDNCFILKVKDCEITQVTEKFILEALKYARKAKKEEISDVESN